MHKIQKKILDLAKDHDLSLMGPRALARLLGDVYPQQAVHHLGQLKKKGLIYTDLKTRKYKIAKPGGYKIANILNIPIMGSANCGIATELAHNKIQGHLKVSSGIVGRKSPNGLMVIKAVGNSLNDAQKLQGGKIEEGDYVIVDCKNKKPENGEYVLSILDDAANLKRFFNDKKNKQIKLVSESTEDIAPIYIDYNDYSDYFINGVVVRVIKK